MRDGRRDIGVELAQLVGIEPLDADAVALGDGEFDPRLRTLSFPDPDLADWPDQTGKVFVTEQLAPAGERILVQRAHSVRDAQHVLHPARRDPAQQPWQRGREVRGIPVSYTH